MDEPDGVTTQGSTSGSSFLGLEIFVDDFGLQAVCTSVFVLTTGIRSKNRENVDI